MKAELIITVVVYWIIIGFVFAPQLNSPLNDQGFTGNSTITDQVDTSGEVTGIYISDVFRLLGIIFLGIGLPDETPVTFSYIFFIIQFFITVLFIVGLIS